VFVSAFHHESIFCLHFVCVSQQSGTSTGVTLTFSLVTSTAGAVSAGEMAPSVAIDDRCGALLYIARWRWRF
jgi:hypothetical protein